MKIEFDRLETVKLAGYTYELMILEDKIVAHRCISRWGWVTGCASIGSEWLEKKLEEKTYAKF